MESEMAQISAAASPLSLFGSGAAVSSVTTSMLLLLQGFCSSTTWAETSLPVDVNVCVAGGDVGGIVLLIPSDSQTPNVEIVPTTTTTTSIATTKAPMMSQQSTTTLKPSGTSAQTPTSTSAATTQTTTTAAPPVCVEGFQSVTGAPTLFRSPAALNHASRIHFTLRSKSGVGVVVGISSLQSTALTTYSQCEMLIRIVEQKFEIYDETTYVAPTDLTFKSGQQPLSLFVFIIIIYIAFILIIIV